MKKQLNKIYACLMALVVVQIIPITTYAGEYPDVSVGVEDTYEINELREEFKEVFPEYKERIEECDELVQNTQSGIMLLSVEEEESVVESITRSVDDGTYTLTFYSDGGYSEVAFWETDISITFSNGTEYNTYYKNCRVSTYLSDPGIISYTGGMIGDTISYYKSGTFYNGQYGSYINVGVQPGYETDVAFLSTSSNEVLVLGKATGLLYIGDLNTILVEETVLRIKLNANAAPTVEFGYLNDIVD